MYTAFQNPLIWRGSLWEQVPYFLLKDGRIVGISEVLPQEYVVVDACGCYLVPGFIDLHVHGGGGYDFMDSTPDAFEAIRKTHAQHGTTTLVPTTLAGKWEELDHFLQVYESEHDKPIGARCAGIHLEGPYFSMEQRGAQDPAYLSVPRKEEYESILKKSKHIVRWDAAPELEGALEFGNVLTKKGIIVAAAHTDANAQEILQAAQHGYQLMTHLYSGMRGVTRVSGIREAGAVEGALLSDDIKVELIADGKHLPLEILKLVHKIKGPQKCALITDAMRAAGTQQEESYLGSRQNGQRVIIKDGVAKLPDESALAGSVATTDILLRTVCRAGIPLQDAIIMLTETPARILGKYPEIGSLENGACADCVLLDQDLKVKSVYVAGALVN